MNIELINISLVENIFKIIFFIALGIQVFYYLFFYARIIFAGKTKENKPEKAMSVIICAKNEAENLEKFLPKFLNQKYDKFEVIVVNDASQDNTEEVLVKLRDKYKKLYFTSIESNRNFSHGKKLALSIGIKAAKNEILVMSDADCYPASENWLSEINNSYNENSNLILAYGGYERKKGFLNKIIRFDAMFIALQYMTYAKAGIVYMGTGRNLSYKKELYESVKGFSSHYHIPSGDDDLLVNSAAKNKYTQTVFSKESFTRSLAKNTFKEYIAQKRRHLSTGKYYKFFHKFTLGTEIMSRFLMYLSFVILLAISINPIVYLYLFGIRFILQVIIISISAKKYNEKGLYFYIPFFDILLPLINIWILISNIFINQRKKRAWK